MESGECVHLIGEYNKMEAKMKSIDLFHSNTNMMRPNTFLRQAGMGILLLCLQCFFSLNIQAEDKGDDKTLSPYFYVNSDIPGEDQLPLKHTEADVNIAGVIADVVVTQVYVNEGTKPIEAIYVFPASTRAAVYGMTMTIGERVLYAKIKEREQARKDYEQAKSEGKSASLLEQQRPNVFQMNVANIMPGDSIVVVLRYTEMLVPEAGVYEFVYPTVVGPRYSDQPVATASTNDLWVENPYMQEGETAPYSFNIKASLNAGIPIKEAVCMSHDTKINYTGPKSAKFVLMPDEQDAGNKDFVLRYRLAGDQIASGILLYEGEQENFFIAMMQPPKRVVPEQIPGREYIFIVDVSGSMNGFPLDISKQLLNDLISKLKPTDRFNVLLFAAGNSVLGEQSLAATPANIQKAINLINNQQGSGGTQLLPALKRALNLPKEKGYSRNIVIATDGYVSVEREAFDLIRKNLNDANFFSFGIGSSVNRFIIEGMARVGMGEPFVITNQAEASVKADQFREYIESPVLTDIKVSYDGFDVYDIEPSYIPDVLADRPIIIQGKWKGDPKGVITIKGESGEGRYTASLQVSSGDMSDDNSALRYLWARNRIALLDDYNKLSFKSETKEEVTQLGVDYNLLTAYTSFIAIDNQVRNKDGEYTTVKQPLPLPDGVSDMAVGKKGYTRVQGSGMIGTYGYDAPTGGFNSSGGSYQKQELKQITLNFSNGDQPMEEVDEEPSLGFATEDRDKADVPAEELELGNYTLTVTEANGCKIVADSMSVHITSAPSFRGGEEKMKAYIQSNMKKVESISIKGTVWVEVTVDVNGKLKGIRIHQGISTKLDEEALRLVKNMPDWKPGESNGNAVQAKVLIPIEFK